MMSCVDPMRNLRGRLFMCLLGHELCVPAQRAIIFRFSTIYCKGPRFMDWDSLKVDRLCLREVNNCPWSLNTDGCNRYRFRAQLNLRYVRLVAFPPRHSSGSLPRSYGGPPHTHKSIQKITKGENLSPFEQPQHMPLPDHVSQRLWSPTYQIPCLTSKIKVFL